MICYYCCCGDPSAQDDRMICHVIIDEVISLSICQKEQSKPDLPLSNNDKIVDAGWFPDMTLILKRGLGFRNIPKTDQTCHVLLYHPPAANVWG
jgi:hypothetical protein